MSEINIELPRVSHSQMAVFNQCNYKWQLMYKDRWKSIELAQAPHQGILGHELLEIYYNHLNTLGSKKAYELVKLHAQVQFTELMTKDEKFIQRGATALRVVDKYVKEFSPYEDKNWNVLKTEYKFEVPIITPTGKEVVIEGYIDALVSIKNKLWIVDHKFVMSNFWDEVAVNIDSQFTTYAACMNLLGYPVQGIIVNQLNMYQYKNYDKEPPEKFFRRVKTNRSMIEQQNTLREIAYLVDDMFDRQERDLPMRKSLTKDCKNCSFVDVCLFHLKGIDPEPFLLQTHAKRGPSQYSASNSIFEIEIP